jgi:hypothetical protein
MENVLRLMIVSYDKVYFHVDGLDAEFSNTSDSQHSYVPNPRQQILEFVGSLRKIKLITISQDASDFDFRVAKCLKVEILAIPDQDIQEDVWVVVPGGACS